MIGSKQKLSRSKHPKDSNVFIRMNVDNITWVSSSKYLGIQIENCLTWDIQKSL